MSVDWKMIFEIVAAVVALAIACPYLVPSSHR
jgi:hypothetical protein